MNEFFLFIYTSIANTGGDDPICWHFFKLGWNYQVVVMYNYCFCIVASLHRFSRVVHASRPPKSLLLLQGCGDHRHFCIDPPKKWKYRLLRGMSLTHCHARPWFFYCIALSKAQRWSLNFWKRTRCRMNFLPVMSANWSSWFISLLTQVALFGVPPEFPSNEGKNTWVLSQSIVAGDRFLWQCQRCRWNQSGALHCWYHGW